VYFFLFLEVAIEGERVAVSEVDEGGECLDSVPVYIYPVLAQPGK
jgi:hypothetical protein